MNKFLRFNNFILAFIAFNFCHNIAEAKTDVTKTNFPQEIFIKTRTETFNSRSFFIIRDGRIWTRKNSQDPRYKWHIMPNNGLPYSLKEKDFPKPEKIVEINADGDEMIAIDNKGRFYTTQEVKGMDYKDLWHYRVGFPKDPIVHDQFTKNNRALTRGRRHFDVMWYEDRFGNQHHYGTMGTSTIYLLSSDGKEIMYTDNGLPADFSHRICGPDRGRFIGLNLQASGGTMFIINEQGKMYTKMDDFDLNGGTAMFYKYTYKPYRSTLSGKDYKSATTPVGLPPEDWKKQPEIKLKNKARITKKITILQTGYGNESRELRVAGLDQYGNKGFYYKKIFNNNWLFKKADITLNKNDFINTKTPSKNLNILNQDLKYNGYINLSDGTRYKAEFKDFNLQCSPATLLVHLGNKKAEIKFHSIEAWTYIRRLDPGRDGTPKVFMGTFDIKPDQLKLLPEELRKLNLETFAFSVAATLQNIYIKSVNEDLTMDFGLEGKVPDRVKSKMQVKIAYKNQYIFIDDLKKKVKDLKIPYELLKEDLTIASLPKLKAEVKKLESTQKLFIQYSNTNKKFFLQQRGIMLFYGIIEKTVSTLYIDRLIIFSDKGTDLVNAYYTAGKSDYDSIKKGLDEKITEIGSFIRDANKKMYNFETQLPKK